ncbi:TetR/AcrR family transcriptional regulator [Umezawaea tangerina]|uniref:TetR family transcriptional regulator n=1 Tax=Umezawaea tangerina TaxID=84725 RepID=A0A2T0SP15_9PSEU|nr:TetR/AcrR family transcriptional regulator [Umezawaea tangerina]PRY35155.1 TetR family transcriptional regulator [Umezawaea tangerina]
MTRDTVPVATVRPLRRDAELNRRKIIASARDVFSERGFGATLDDIAHHAGLGVGTVYRRFPSKEHLVEAMFADRLDEIGALAEQALTEGDPWDAFANLLLRTAALHADDRGLREVMLSNNFGRERVAESKARLIPLAMKVVQRAKDSGQLRADFEATDIAIIHMMIGSVIEYTQDVRPELWRRYLGVLLDGLRADRCHEAELPRKALDVQSLETVMCTWQPHH